MNPFLQICVREAAKSYFFVVLPLTGGTTKKKTFFETREKKSEKV